MKTILAIVVAGLSLMISFQACTKEELVTVNEPLELDENSPQYQQYMEERAIQLIKEYRFDRLDNTIDRIKDPATRERVLALLTEYRERAFNEALYYAKPNGDTIFFFPPNIDDRKEAKRLYISNIYQKAVTNEIGVLHGFKNFPKVETVDMGNSLATGIKDLDGMPELKTFNWIFDTYYFAQYYPDIELAPVPLTFDFSQNQKLETVNIAYVNLMNLKFPAAKIKNVNLGTALINSDDEINKISTESLRINGVSEIKDWTLTSKATESLILEVSGIQSLDMSQTALKTLTIATGVEKIKFNEGVKNLDLRAGALKEQPTFPTSIEEMTIRDYPFAANYPNQLKKLSYTYNNGQVAETNLSHLTQLDSLFIGYYTDNDYADYPNRMEIRGSTIKMPEGLKYFALGTSGVYDINVDGMKFPVSTKAIKFDIATINEGNLDLSNLSNLREFTAYILRMNGGAIKLPPSVEKVNITSSSILINELDLSQLTNLKYLNLGEFGYIYNQPSVAVTLILPPNLSENVFSYAAEWYAKPITLKTGSTIVNKPDWFDKYVNYVD